MRGGWGKKARNFAINFLINDNDMCCTLFEPFSLYAMQFFFLTCFRGFDFRSLCKLKKIDFNLLAQLQYHACVFSFCDVFFYGLLWTNGAKNSSWESQWKKSQHMRRMRKFPSQENSTISRITQWIRKIGMATDVVGAVRTVRERERKTKFRRIIYRNCHSFGVSER